MTELTVRTIDQVIELRETTVKELSQLLGIRHNACLHRFGRAAGEPVAAGDTDRRHRQARRELDHRGCVPRGEALWGEVGDAQLGGEEDLPIAEARLR